MRYRSVKAVRAALYYRGGWLEDVRESEEWEYAPHFVKGEEKWVNGVFTRKGLIEWANRHLV